MLRREMPRKARAPGGPDGTDLRIAATERAVRAALIRIAGDLSQAGLAEDAAGLAELVLAEALNNVVEHACAGVEAAWIEISVRREGVRLFCELCDNGRPMPGGKLPQGHAPDPDALPEDLPEGGFGWHLIRRLTTALEYRRDEGVNHLSFAIEFPPGLSI
jgi:serine/threonine-protein kinase RsbW